ncbi:glycosyltransferase family 9 protein [Uliginosibacterium sp. 31-16]|uniref:glycosyltransferase family 9 protein n=1 Tax=Uliginosibacterium sp. 31-16 TaxID=3068315 RepID=UPI00273E493A|nr:glycosyltransferase family 9 protein [Uliginosibacterium sp. 31-16]MDP5239147.1 glycosyltransferase family 9 protein [Uliginosibacterium sp. 31-16]
MSRTAARLFILRSLALQALDPRASQRGPSEEPRRILVLQHLLLGDTLMLTPLLAKLAARYPQAERFLACAPAFAPLYANHPFGIQTLSWNPRKGDIATLRAAAPFDLIIIPAENRYSPLARVLGRRVVAFADDTPAWKNWLIDDARPFPHSPAAFGDFCAGLIDGAAPAPYRPGDWPLPPAKSFERPSRPYAVLHLGASTPLKYWPAARWLALADWLATQGVTPVWSGGPKETALVQAADPQGRYASTAGQLDLPQLAQLLAGARLMVCPDTGVTHLARIAGVPTVALFGPGSSLISGAGEYWRNSPFTALSIDIACRNQAVTFRRHRDWIQRCARGFGEQLDQCPRPRCMEGITFETVQTACAAQLANHSPRETLA